MPSEQQTTSSQENGEIEVRRYSAGQFDGGFGSPEYPFEPRSTPSIDENLQTAKAMIALSGQPLWLKHHGTVFEVWLDMNLVVHATFPAESDADESIRQIIENAVKRANTRGTHAESSERRESSGSFLGRLFKRQGK